MAWHWAELELGLTAPQATSATADLEASAAASKPLTISHTARTISCRANEVAADDVSVGEADWLGLGATAPVLRAGRVLLRAWRAEDLEPFGALNADARVMEHYPAALTRAESDDFVRRVIPQFATRGFSLWAVEVPGIAPFIGYVGLVEATFETRFTPCVEIGWRLAYPYWGHGYATEGARAVLAYGFAAAGLDEIVSFTVPANRRSVAVMERLNMTQDGEFNHPRLPHGHPLQRHLLYRLSKRAWRRDTASSDTLKGHW